MRSVARWLGVAAVVAGAVVIVVAVLRPTNNRTITRGDDVTLVSTDRAAGRGSRPIYRHSVIPGGVYNAGELIAATGSDPVVFARYSSVSRTNVRTSAVVRPRRAYMSYRIGNEIFWTKGKLLLNAGETTLTNGDVEIRSRCGNQISDTAMLPTSDAEPDSVEFDRLVADEPGLLASNRLPGAVDAVSPALRGAASAEAPVAAPVAAPGTAPATASVIGDTALSTAPVVISDRVAPLVILPVAGGTSRGRGSLESTTTAPLPGREPAPVDAVPPAESLFPPGDDAPPADLIPPADFEVATVAHVPEPGTIVLLGTALTGLAAMLLRKRRIARRRADSSPPT